MSNTQHCPTCGIWWPWMTHHCPPPSVLTTTMSAETPQVEEPHLGALDNLAWAAMEDGHSPRAIRKAVADGIARWQRAQKRAAS